MGKSSNFYESDSFVSRVHGAVKRYENTGALSHIGFVDELLLNEAGAYFRENAFTQYSVFFPREDAKRPFLTIGDEMSDLNIVYVRAVADKFHTLFHRDFFGGLMSLGIDRKYFGDILVTTSSRAYFPLWNKADICSHIFDNFSSCGKAKIYLDVIDKSIYDGLEMQYEEMETIVSSLRADCFVSALTGFSRTQAKKLIELGDFKISSHAVFDPDTTIKTGTDFSIRGFGKYKFFDVVGTTRKERIRIKLLKFGNYTERIY